MDLILAKVETENEIATVAEMASQIWFEYFVSIISKEQIAYMVEKFQSAPAMTEQIKRQGYEYYVMKAEGRNVGYLAVKEDQGKLFLSKFYIRKEERGKGYASQAMEQLTGRCKERKLASIWLTVNRHNHSAIAVYNKKGFKTVKTQVADIGNGFVMDDYVMEKTIG
ncbi:GNAT family N-acetyltransferase [Paenibacillus sp. FSL W8-0194]|uniref:GNAT family N-acetyltransferase n=1 Tax=Paenibacillus sp. FSL W8-0194 TaxID=2921711 RepID=UPI0030DADEBB